MPVNYWNARLKGDKTRPGIITSLENGRPTRVTFDQAVNTTSIILTLFHPAHNFVHFSVAFTHSVVYDIQENAEKNELSL